MSNIFRFIIIALLLALSFLFSSAESVYSTTNRLRLQKDIEEKKRNSRQVNAIVNDYENTVLTILLGNNFSDRDGHYLR